MNEQFFPCMLRSACCGTILLLLALTSLPCKAQVSVRHPVSDTQDATPEPAIPAILIMVDLAVDRGNDLLNRSNRA
jgi:hypothetical protein